MPDIHRHGDARYCGATTVVEGQNKVYVAGKLVSVVGDPNSHWEGRFLDNSHKVVISGRRVITVDDPATSDNQLHPTGPTNAAQGHGKVVVR